MTASQIIDEIKRLQPEEQRGVIRFAYQLDAERMLTGKEIGELAQRMIDSADPAEKLRLREEMTRGFYGESASAWNPASWCAANLTAASVRSRGRARYFC